MLMYYIEPHRECQGHFFTAKSPLFLRFFITLHRKGILHGMAELFIDQKGYCRDDHTFDKVKGDRTKEDVSVDGIDHRVDRVAGGDDGIDGHDLGVKRNDQKAVGKSTDHRDRKRSQHAGKKRAFFIFMLTSRLFFLFIREKIAIF